MSRHFSWTALQVRKLEAVQTVLVELEAYKPLTLRQIYYQLVSREVIENKNTQYNMLSQLLKWARLDGFVAWRDIEDRVRAVHSNEGWEDEETFFDAHFENFLTGYRRHLAQTQAAYVEVWIEKDALSRLFSTVTRKYCVSTVVCRGFSSVTFLQSYAKRVAYHEQQGQRPVMLYFGDFDPSGEEMFISMGTTLRDELNIEALRMEKVALTLGDIKEYRLPHDPRALKHSDPRASRYVALYGALAVELDALAPDVLERKIRTAIEEEFDMDLFVEEYNIQKDERETLAEVKESISKHVNSLDLF